MLTKMWKREKWKIQRRKWNDKKPQIHIKTKTRCAACIECDCSRQWYGTERDGLGWDGTRLEHLVCVSCLFATQNVNLFILPRMNFCVCNIFLLLVPGAGCWYCCCCICSIIIIIVVIVATSVLVLSLCVAISVYIRSFSAKQSQ